MQTGIIILIILLVIVIIVMIVLTYLYQRANTISNQNNIIYPFSASIQPGNKTAPLTNAAGTSQIDCSAVGGKINIIGSWVETIDPFGECANQTISVLNLSCGVTAGIKIPCKQDSDCGSGMECAAGLCKVAACPGNSDGTFHNSKCSCGGSYCPIRPGSVCTGLNDNKSCGDKLGMIMQCTNTGKGSTGYTCEVNSGQNCMAPDTTGQFCALYPLCSNITVIDSKSGANVNNNICALSPSNDVNKCRARDNSGYISSKCNGKTTCNLQFDPEDPMSGFGPRPCNSNVQTGNTLYNQLPNIPGQGGNYAFGYYTHGIYSCITS